MCGDTRVRKGRVRKVCLRVQCLRARVYVRVYAACTGRVLARTHVHSRVRKAMYVCVHSHERSRAFMPQLCTQLEVRGVYTNSVYASPFMYASSTQGLLVCTHHVRIVCVCKVSTNTRERNTRDTKNIMLYIYIYIQRERERERHREICICIHIYIYIYIYYIYIFIYICVCVWAAPDLNCTCTGRFIHWSAIAWLRRVFCASPTRRW